MILHFSMDAQSVFETSSSGDWNKNSTWNLVSGSGKTPGAGDNAIIQAGHTVTVKLNEDINNVTLNGGTISINDFRSLTVSGNVTTTASSSIPGYSENQVFVVNGTLNVSSGRTLTVGAIKFEIQGASTINGTLAISGYGAKPRDFGNITINSGATMTVAGADLYTFNGNITNNGTFTANDQTEFRFAKSGGTIGGSNVMSMYKVVFNSPASYTNNGKLTVRNDMSGTGSFTNGAGGELELQNTGPFTVSTFSASATGNTVTYTGYGSPTAFSGNYYNLVLNKSSGSLNFGSSLTVSNNLTVKSGILQVNAVTLTIGNNLVLEGGEFTPDNGSAVVNIAGNVIGTGGQYDHNNGDVNVTGNVNISGTEFLFDGASSTLDAGSFTMNNAAITFSSGAITTTGGFTLNGTSNLIVNNASATLSVGGLFSLVNGTTNLSAGTFSAGSISVAAGKELVLGNIPTTVTGTTTVNGTITFNASGSAKNFNSILVNSGGSWAVTQPNNFTVSGNITNNGSFTDPGYGTSIYTLTNSSGTIGGSSALSIRDILINSPASYTNTANLTVAGSLNGTGTFINGATGTLRYQGDNSGGSNFTISNFTASASGNTVVYGAASSSQRWKTTTNGYDNVTINFTGTGDYQRLQLVSNIRVNGTLNIIAGDPLLNSYNLELGTSASITGGSATEYIRRNSTGVVRKYYSGTGGSIFLPIGDVNNYSPITDFTLSGGTVGGGAYIDFSVTDAVHPQMNAPNKASGGDDADTVATAYISRYWTVSGSGITGPSFSATYKYIDDDVTGTESNMVAALRRTKEGTMGPVLDWKNAGTVNPSTNTVSMDSGDGFGDMYAMDDEQTRLPIVLLSFTTEVSKSTVLLKWSTASELDNDFFTIERSRNGVDFEPILYVPGKGTSEVTNNYVTVDGSPISGRSYYRLKQTDFNGQFDYSEMKSVLYKSDKITTPNFTVYPNSVLAGQTINIRPEGEFVDETAIIQLLSIAGQRVLEYNFQLSKEASFEIPQDVQAGYYVLSVTGSSFKKSFKIIIK
ncbi:T9SS type A sorting domain-containing protein [Roseivirga sp.]|uniref:T9SS type A sorting domain-containing protein n=1 Tax=Roseivirga sp. TaxID=1964215 RepID=UPI002B279ABE|nr:T9SS type A sorting domain-containing protein [Roseivirga sp.]